MRRIAYAFGLAIAVVQMASGQLANSSWPMDSHDYRLSNSTPSSGPNVPVLKWSKKFTGEYLTGIATGPNGTTYVNGNSALENTHLADSLGYVHAFDRDGNLEWTYTFTDGYPNLTSPALSSSGMLYMHLDGNEGNIAAPEKLYAVDTTGVFRWEYSPGSAVFTGTNASPSIWDDGTIFFASKGCVLFRLNNDGSVNDIYNSPHGSSITNSVPLSGDGRFYLEARVFSLAGDNLWPTTGWGNVYPDINGSVYCTDELNGDSLYVYDPFGTITNQIALPWGDKSNIVAISDSLLVFAKTPYGDSTSVYFASKDISHFSFSQCAKKWYWTTDLDFVIGGSSTTYVMQSWWERSRLYAFDSNGREKWHYDLPAPGTASYEYPAHVVIGPNRTAFITISDAFSSNSYIYALGDSSSDLPLAVEAANFKAAASSGSVVLTWQTQGELSNLGFNIYRKDLAGGASTLVASYSSDKALQGLGTSTIGKTYSYKDSHVTNGCTYEYTIESVALDGTRKDYPPIKVKVDVPKNYALYQNYPNPFNPSTTISYDLPKSSHVTLVVYDELGRKVVTMVDDYKDAGRYKVQFEGTRLSSGVYFFSLDAGAYHDTKKLLLLK